MITLRKANERGGGRHGWLDSRHTFSFSDYHDPRHMGFRALRVINEDRVSPGGGFPRHPHRDMEILSYVLEGGLAHQDSMGTGSVIKPGELQRMSAGTGVFHSEQNASTQLPVHFLQIWLLPDRPGHAPGYEQKAFPLAERQGKLRLIASPDGADGSVSVHQDVKLYVSNLAEGEQATLPLTKGRHAWVQVARGTVRLHAKELSAGDGAALSEEEAVVLRGTAEPSEVLVFDLA